MALSSAEKKLAAQLSFEEGVLLTVKQVAGQTLPIEFEKLELETIRSTEDEEFDADRLPASVEVAKGTDEKSAVLKTRGVFFAVPPADAISIVLDLIAELEASGYAAMLLNEDSLKQVLGKVWEDLRDRGQSPTLIGIIQARDPYDLLRIQGTNATNYDLTTEDIIERLQEWEDLCNFGILSAGGDTLDLAFTTLPDDLEDFAEAVYEFCPDILDQGYLGSPLDEDASAEEFEEALEAQTTDDIVVFLEREKYLSFWWD